MVFNARIITGSCSTLRTGAGLVKESLDLLYEIIAWDVGLTRKGGPRVTDAFEPRIDRQTKYTALQHNL